MHIHLPMVLQVIVLTDQNCYANDRLTGLDTTRYGKHVSLTFSLPKCLGVMHATTYKGQAVKAVLAEKGLQIEDAIALGYAVNDIEMLSLYSWAMRNKHDAKH